MTLKQRNAAKYLEKDPTGGAFTLVIGEGAWCLILTLMQSDVPKYSKKAQTRAFLAAKAAPISRNVRSLVSQLVNKLKKAKVRLSKAK